MDNDNILLQKAADIYRGLRFKMKYRGVDILPAGAGNDLARELLESGQPFLFGRCGATEMRTVADYLQNGGKNFDDRTREDIRNLSGLFPTDDATLEKFCRLYVKCAQNAELLALWNVGAEREVIRGCDATRFTELRALEPYYHAVERGTGGQTGVGGASLPQDDCSAVCPAGAAVPRQECPAGVCVADRGAGRAGPGWAGHRLCQPG